MQVDPKFRQSKAAARRRKTQHRMQLALIGGGGLVAIFLVVGVVIWLVNRPPAPDDGLLISDTTAALAPDGQDGEQITQIEAAAETPAVRLATPFVDIAGDPMILRFDTSDGGKAESLSGPSTLDFARFGAAGPGQLSLVIEDLVVRESRLITALPSSREDFAFFQAQRSRALDEPQVTLAELTAQAEQQTVVVVDDDNSWGEALGASDQAGPTTYVSTRIQNTTSIALVTKEANRTKVFEDLVVRFVRPRQLKDFLTSNDFADDIAERIADAASKTFPDLAKVTGEDGLASGTIIGVRHRVIDGQKTPLFLTIYGPDATYIGTLYRRGLTGYAFGSNPWNDDELPKLASPNQGAFTAQAQDFRLLDAVYSAVIRNGVPTSLVGELIVMLSQSYDLEAVATPGDKITLLYAPERGDGAAQIAYAAITGPSGEMPCYVAPKQSAGSQVEYACFTPRGQRGGGGGGAFVTPVNGTLSSPYGPRFHPVLKEVRLHGGVDWAAPTGTPILAALDGTFAVVGNGGGYGNVVYIDHGQGLQSRYAHMDRFDARSVVGKTVKAGEVIGYVGTTGRSTGPHLHFEFRRNGAPIDPFSLTDTGGGGGGALAASDAVEALTDQIIKVESAGNANAKNPLSTATGLGQFIESTWLRMMRDYRPDLARTMSRAELLALRVDPTLSREMVQNLARENENFLRARGHRVDAGRLYLAHFLGPGGANKVLGSPNDATILNVMGRGVVNANPFLKDYTVADLKAWAQRKMRGAGSGPARPRAPVISAESRAYIEAIDAILEEV